MSPLPQECVSLCNKQLVDNFYSNAQIDSISHAEFTNNFSGNRLIYAWIFFSVPSFSNSQFHQVLSSRTRLYFHTESSEIQCKFKMYRTKKGTFLWFITFDVYGNSFSMDILKENL